MYCDGLGRWWGSSAENIQPQRQGVVQGNTDTGLIRANMSGYETYPRPQSVTPRPQKSEYIPDQG